MVKPPAVGDLVEVVFYDHAENSPDALRFEVIGRLVGVTRLAYKVRSWGYVSDVDRAGDSNTDYEHSYAIVKKAVDTIRILK